MEPNESDINNFFKLHERAIENESEILFWMSAFGSKVMKVGFVNGFYPTKNLYQVIVCIGDRAYQYHIDAKEIIAFYKGKC